MIRIASGQAFWGDWSQAPELQVRSGDIDYLILDYLAEVTIAILDKQRQRDPTTGYARHFISDFGDLIPEIADKEIRVIASAGGVNARGCAEALLVKARELGVTGLKVGVVEGDDVLGSLLGESGPALACSPLEGDSPDWDGIASKMTSARVYLGAAPVVEALRQGAQVVVTGRVTDTALAVAPVLHEFDLAADDWNALSLATVVGHILECGAQSSGGNYLENWRSVPNAEYIGFPIAEMHAPDRAVITKHESLGGLVTLGSVKEQLLYEIGDPRSYLTADCVADFTSIQLRQEAPNRVEVTGVTGRPAPETLKVSCVYDAGWKVSGQITYCWPEALSKARVAGELVRKRTERKCGDRFDEWCIETIGAGACHRTIQEVGEEPHEVVLRVSARSSDRSACEELGRQLVGLVLTGPPGATGYAGGRPRPSQLQAIWSGLVPRDEVKPRVEVLTS